MEAGTVDAGEKRGQLQEPRGEMNSVHRLGVDLREEGAWACHFCS